MCQSFYSLPLRCITTSSRGIRKTRAIVKHLPVAIGMSTTPRHTACFGLLLPVFRVLITAPTLPLPLPSVTAMTTYFTTSIRYLAAIDPPIQPNMIVDLYVCAGL